MSSCCFSTEVAVGLFYRRLWPSIYLLLLFIITIYSKMDWVRFRDMLSYIMSCAKDTQTGKTSSSSSSPEEDRHWFRVCLKADLLPESFHSGQNNCWDFKLEWIGSLYNYRLYAICSSWFVCVPLQWRDCEIILRENIWAIFNAIWMDDICAFIYLILHYINVSRQAREPDAFFHWWQLDFGSIIRLRLTTLACEKKD